MRIGAIAAGLVLSGCEMFTEIPEDYNFNPAPETQPVVTASFQDDGKTEWQYLRVRSNRLSGVVLGESFLRHTLGRKLYPNLSREQLVSAYGVINYDMRKMSEIAGVDLDSYIDTLLFDESERLLDFDGINVGRSRIDASTNESGNFIRNNFVGKPVAALGIVERVYSADWHGDGWNGGEFKGNVLRRISIRFCGIDDNAPPLFCNIAYELDSDEKKRTALDEEERIRCLVGEQALVFGSFNETSNSVFRFPWSMEHFGMVRIDTNSASWETHGIVSLEDAIEGRMLRGLGEAEITIAQDINVCPSQRHN